jgi:hypothetical protein
MRFIFSLILTALFSFVAHAERYAGLVRVDSLGILFNNSKTAQTYSLIGATPIISSHLQKLKTADFISFVATASSTRTQLVVSSINYVGLNTLLGYWEAPKGWCFNFTSYTNFYTYKKTPINCQNGSKIPAEATETTYLVMPKTQNWTMLVSGRTKTLVADLTLLGADLVKIEIFHPETGEILSLTELKRR